MLGSEIAGELDGGARDGLRPRAKAAAMPSASAVDRRWLLPLPANASFAEGAAFPMAFLTAWIPLTELVRIAFGARVLVTAAAGAVGYGSGADRPSAQRRSRSRRSGSAEKLELPRSLGAVEAVTYEEIGELEPVDVVFDLVGGDVFAASLELLKPMGTAIAVGYAGGMWQEVESGLARRPQHRRPRLLPRPADRSRPGARRARRARTSCGSGRAARCARSSAPSSRSSEAAEAHRLDRDPANRQERSCSFHDSARDRLGRRHRQRRS